MTNESRAMLFNNVSQLIMYVAELLLRTVIYAL